jgi:hypothetical protein
MIYPKFVSSHLARGLKCHFQGFLACLALAAIAQAATQATLYVSPTGSGTTFTQAQPGTLTGAQNKVRTMTTGMTGDIIVYLEGGTYTLTSSFQMLENSSTHDSGTNGFNVIYEAVPGQTPIISGGQVVTGWSLFDSTKNIYRASVGTGVNSRQLYVNGARAMRTRGPSPAGLTKTSAGFTTTDTTMQNWINQSDIEFVERSTWKHLRCPVASIVGTTITMQTPAWTNEATSPDPGHPFNGNGLKEMDAPITWLENVYELLTDPGQWYLDRSGGYVYYIPRFNENMTTATVVLPVVEKLIDASGGSFTTPIHNIVFSGITFEYATWLWPSTSQGYADNQAGILWENSPATAVKGTGNISFQTSSNIQLINNTFIHLGGAAIDFGNGAHTNTVMGNVIQDVSSGGILLGGLFDYNTTDPNQMTDGNVLKDNYISRIGVEFEDAVGIWVSYAKNTVIQYNEIDDTPYTGISVGWGWGTNSYAENNQVLNNHVYDVMDTLLDGGSVYTLSSQPSSLINNNYFENSVSTRGHGIYLDEGTTDYSCNSNVVQKPGGNWLNIWTTSIQDNTINDTWTDSSSILNDGTNNTITNTVLVSNDNWPSGAVSVINAAGLEAAYKGIVPSAHEVNDADITFDHVPSDWAYSSLRDVGDYGGDVHTSSANGQYVQYTFTGTGITFVSEKNTNMGNVDVYIDGVLQTTVSCHSATQESQQNVFSISGLTSGSHAIKLVNNGGSLMTVDAFIVSTATSNQAATPVFSPGGGTYTSTQIVTITSATGGASIRYTTDGSTPTETHGTVYSSPVSISATATLEAIAYESGFTDSNVTSAVYTIGSQQQAAAPTFSPVGGTYSSAQSVTIASTTSGASIRYTTDGSTPTETHGTVYSSAVSISATTTLEAIAYESGFTDSNVTSAVYTIGAQQKVAAPTFNPVGGTYSRQQSVTIASTTSGASIRYTVNGSTPTETHGTLYSGSVNITSTTTLEAIAYKSGLTDSTVTSATYTIKRRGGF